MPIGYSLLKAGLAASQHRAYRALRRAAAEPEIAQSRVLLDIVAQNADTAFGRAHGFAKIKDVADFRRAVPIATFEDLRGHVERQERTGPPCLTRQPPVYYSRTSGTIAAPKNIPVTPAGLTRIRAQRRLAAYALSKVPGLLAGKVFAVTGQAVEGRMPGGTPYGSMSGLLYRQQPRLLRSRHVLPAEISAIQDYDAQYLAMAIYGLAEPEVSCVGTANASTLLRLLGVVNAHAEAILRGIADGRLPDGAAGPGPNPRRARQLAAMLASHEALTFADVWPRLAGVVTWKGGSCGVAIRNLEPALPDACSVVELGYIASEVHGTVNVEPLSDVCLPALSDTFFEFAERHAWEAGEAELLSLGELAPDRDYYVVVTTCDGLYRYDMNDIVRVTGRVARTPTLAFVQKGKGVTSITGEKLTEAQVLDAVAFALDERGLRSPFFIVLADRQRAGYTFYAEGAGCSADLATVLDRRLAALNVEYESKRASGRLAPLRARGLRPGSGEAYRAQRVAAGQREAQFKYLHLQYADECPFDFAAATAP